MSMVSRICSSGGSTELFRFYASRHYRMPQPHAYIQRQRALAHMLRAPAPPGPDVVLAGHRYLRVRASCSFQCQSLCPPPVYFTVRPILVIWA